MLETKTVKTYSGTNRECFGHLAWGKRRVSTDLWKSSRLYRCVLLLYHIWLALSVVRCRAVPQKEAQARGQEVEQEKVARRNEWCRVLRKVKGSVLSLFDIVMLVGYLLEEDAIFCSYELVHVITDAIESRSERNKVPSFRWRVVNGVTITITGCKTWVPPPPSPTGFRSSRGGVYQGRRVARSYRFRPATDDAHHPIPVLQPCRRGEKPSGSIGCRRYVLRWTPNVFRRSCSSMLTPA